MTTVLVSSAAFLDEHRDLAKKIVQANKELTDWIFKHPGRGAKTRQCGVARRDAQHDVAGVDRECLEADHLDERYSAKSSGGIRRRFAEIGLHEDRAGFVPALCNTVMSLKEELQIISPSKLSVEKVSKRFRTSQGEIQALEEVSLQVGEGEFVCLVGAERLRQIDPAQHHRRARKAGRRAGARRRQAGDRAGARPDGDVPGIGALPVAGRDGQRALRAEAQARI